MSWRRRMVSYRAECGHTLAVGVPARCRGCYLAVPDSPAMARLGQRVEEVRRLLGTLTLTAAADFLVVDRRTLAQFCRARGLPYGRPGRKKREAAAEIVRA